MRLLPLLVLVAILPACASQRIAGQPRDLEQAAATPLYDINVLRTKIPVALIEAEERPYELPSPLTCRTIETAITALDDALGPDLDSLPTADNPSALERSAQVARGASVALVEGGAASLVPFRSWVRRLSGAERNDRVVRESIVAGGVRRAFLKGLGYSQNCLEPAKPTVPALAGHDLNPPPSPAVSRPEPKYPIR
jgi:hypothetical protein